MAQFTLRTGDVYAVDQLQLVGWTDGDGSGHDGYDYREYFDSEGRYLGPDQHGIEPVVQVSTTTYAVRRYSDGLQVGRVDLTAEQFHRYESLAQQPEGLVHLGVMPHDLYNLDPEWQHLGEDTTIFLE